MPRILITGANRGLGLAIAQRFFAKEWSLSVTGRDLAALRSVYQEKSMESQFFSLDLMANDSEAQIEALFDEEAKFDAIVHCASPYTMERFLDSSIDTMRQYTNCMFSDQLIAMRAIGHLKDSGSFLATGAVVGLPDFFGKGEIGLLKSHQRQLMGICAHEVAERELPVYVKNLDLGTFRDDVVDPDSELSTEYVVDAIGKIIENPDRFPNTVHLLSKSNERYFNVESTDIEGAVACAL